MKLKVKVTKKKNLKILKILKKYHLLKKFILFMILLININYLTLEFMQMVQNIMQLIMLKVNKKVVVDLCHLLNPYLMVQI